MHPLRSIIHATTRVETIYPSGDVGHGTGFYMSLAKQGDQHIPVIITNKHVVDGGAEFRFPITIQDAAGGPAGYQTVRLPSGQLPIVYHPEPHIDLAAIPIGPIFRQMAAQKLTPLWAPFTSELIADQKYLADLYPLEVVTMIGYPNAIWDHVNNQPVMRQGVIATDPGRDYQGNPEFLCDIAAFPGSSGSPLMLLNHGSFVTPDGNMAMGSRIKLLGVLYAGPQHRADGEIRIVNIPTTQRAFVESKIPNNLGVMIKAYKILGLELELRKLSA